jgi:hypothetical protein
VNTQPVCGADCVSFTTMSTCIRWPLPRVGRSNCPVAAFVVIIIGQDSAPRIAGHSAGPAVVKASFTVIEPSAYWVAPPPSCGACGSRQIAPSVCAAVRLYQVRT